MKRYQLFALSHTAPRGGSLDVAAQADTLEALFAAYRATSAYRPARFEVLDMDERRWLTKPSAMIDCTDYAEALNAAQDYTALGFCSYLCPGEGSNGRIYRVNVSC